MVAKIYPLKSVEWKGIGHFSCARPPKDGKLLNGAPHWMACKIFSLG